jgi:hypothetical protein
MARETHILPILAHRLFSPPHISRKLTIFSVGCIIVDIFLILIRQPAKYWISYKFAESEWFSPLLAVHPLIFIGAVLIGLLIVHLLMDGLAIIPAFILWVIVIFSQIYYITYTTLWILYNHKLGLNRSEQEITVLVLSLAISGVMGFIVTRTSLIDARPQAETGIPARANKKRLARVILISGPTILFLLLSFGLYQHQSSDIPLAAHQNQACT